MRQISSDLIALQLVAKQANKNDPTNSFAKKVHAIATAMLLANDTEDEKEKAHLHNLVKVVIDFGNEDDIGYGIE